MNPLRWIAFVGEIIIALAFGGFVLIELQLFFNRKVRDYAPRDESVIRGGDE